MKLPSATVGLGSEDVVNGNVSDVITWGTNYHMRIEHCSAALSVTGSLTVCVVVVEAVTFAAPEAMDWADDLAALDVELVDTFIEVLELVVALELWFAVLEGLRDVFDESVLEELDALGGAVEATAF